MISCGWGRKEDSVDSTDDVLSSEIVTPSWCSTSVIERESCVLWPKSQEVLNLRLNLILYLRKMISRTRIHKTHLDGSLNIIKYIKDMRYTGTKHLDTT